MKLYQVTGGRLCAGFIVDDRGIVVLCAPVLRKYLHRGRFGDRLRRFRVERVA